MESKLSLTNAVAVPVMIWTNGISINAKGVSNTKPSFLLKLFFVFIFGNNLWALKLRNEHCLSKKSLFLRLFHLHYSTFIVILWAKSMCCCTNVRAWFSIALGLLYWGFSGIKSWILFKSRTTAYFSIWQGNTKNQMPGSLFFNQEYSTVLTVW